MSHDKIKAAARERMARTGEPYAAARRQVIAEIRAAAAAHEELGPEYSDAVVASFLERVEEEIDARVDARMAEARRPGGAGRPGQPARAADGVSRSASSSACSSRSRSAATPMSDCTAACWSWPPSR